MKKFASVLVQLKTLALEKIEQKLESKRLELQQNEREVLDKQAQLSAFKNPELGGMSLFTNPAIKKRSKNGDRILPTRERELK